ncbi:MAG: hypothetical protein EXS55_03380 [Candidatus Magasanikbacteria bacterium]|nr:hypothetical protein [Candidatus Magasanikbacteria bacterium]
MEQELTPEKLASLTQAMNAFRTVLIKMTDPDRWVAFDDTIEKDMAALMGRIASKSKAEANRAKYVATQEAMLETLDQALEQLKRGRVDELVKFYQVFRELQQRSMKKLNYDLARVEEEDEFSPGSIGDDSIESDVSEEAEEFMEEHAALFAKGNGEWARHILAVDLDVVPEWLPKDSPTTLELLAKILESHGVNVDVSITMPSAN